MSLKNEIEKEMFTEGLEDRIQDIATFIDVPAEDVEKRLKTLSFSDYVEIMTAYKTKDAELIKKTMGLIVDEAYDMGSKGKYGSVAPGEEYAGQEEPVGTTEPTDDMAAMGKVKNARIQAMQRLGRDNLGAITAAQVADAMDKAEQGKPLTPIQRQAIAYQASNLDALAGSPDTRIQFRNLLNKLRKQQQQQQ